MRLLLERAHHFKVLLTNPIHPAAQARLVTAAEVIVAPDTNADTLRRLIADADALIVRAQLPDDIFQYQTRLRAVVRHGVGLDMIPVEAATRAGIPVANVPGSNTTSVAEFCLNAMLNYCRPIERLRLDPSARDWNECRAHANQTLEISGRVLGIVGVGAIGRQLAHRALALGMRVLGLTRTRTDLPEGVEPSTLSEMARAADFLVLCCPLTPETRGMINADTLRAMKPGAVLINVSRGPVVDRQALVERLRSNQLGAAILDVHDIHPIPTGLYPDDIPNLILTPHVAGITAASMRRMSCGAVDEIIRALQGKPLLNPVNLQGVKGA